MIAVGTEGQTAGTIKDCLTENIDMVIDKKSGTKQSTKILFMFINQNGEIPLNFSCNNSNDPFVDEWVFCNHPNSSLIISRTGDKYNIHYVGRSLDRDFILEKKANDIISGKENTFTYDKATNRLTDVEFNQFCKKD